MSITQRLGKSIPADISLTDEAGDKVSFGELAKDRPTLVVPIYFKCTQFCSVLSHELLQSIIHGTEKNAAAPGGRFAVGQDLNVIMLSIDPMETSADAKHYHEIMFRGLDKTPNEKGWYFVTGSLESIRKVTDAIGFKFHYDSKLHEIDHPMGTAMLSAGRKICAYTIGYQLPWLVLEDRMGFAKRNEIAPLADQSNMYGCLSARPAMAARRALIEGIIRGAGGLTLLLTILYIVTMTRRYRFERVSENSIPKGGIQGA